MIYQLNSFEEWTRLTIHPQSLPVPLSEIKTRELLDFAATEKARICNYFREKTITGDPSWPSSKFIHVHQVGVSSISEVILNYTQSKDFKLTPSLEEFYFKVCLIIEEIILALKDHLPEHFNEDLPITHVNVEIGRKHLRSQLKTLDPLYDHPSMDKSLLAIATRPIREFLEEERRISYRELAYLKELAISLRGLLDYITYEDISYELHLTLFSLNFNYPRYVLHYCYWLDAKISEIPDRSKRLDKLSSNIHIIEQIKFKPGFVLMPGLPSITEQLLASIKNTYQYLLTEDRHISHSVIEQINYLPQSHRDKIRLSISVPVLALFLKILIKAGIIINENKSEVFRVISENYTTLKSEVISYESLKGKYNKTPPAAYLQLKNVLIRVLDHLKEL